MPLFEYECSQCKTVFEELVFGDTCPVCPSCHSENTHKLISRPCLHMQASGGAETAAPARSSCSGCSGGHCASCH